MWRIGGGCGPNWTSAGKRVASSDASVVTPPNSSANSRNAVSTQVCHPRKKLGWQSFLDQSLFKFLEIRGWVAAEAATLRPDRLTPFQASTQLLPSLQVRRRQVLAPYLPPQPCRQRRRHPHRPTHHQPRRCYLPAAATPLVIPVGPKQLLQIVVRPWQVGHVIAGEQPWPVAPGHLPEGV